MRIALAQISTGTDKAANLAKMELLVSQAAAEGAGLIVFPEAAMLNFRSMDSSFVPFAEPLDGSFVKKLQALAQRDRIWILAGVFESSPDADRVYNTLVLCDNQGSLRETYRKIHLYDSFGWRESDKVLPGNGDTLLFECERITFGAMTCYDLRFPELARHLTYQGAQALILPAAWFGGPMKETQFEILLRARAIENTVYMCSSVQVENGFVGSSMVIDPMGVVQACRGELEGIIVSELQPERVESVRAFATTLQNRRSDVYSRWREVRWYD